MAGWRRSEPEESREGSSAIDPPATLDRAGRNRSSELPAKLRTPVKSFSAGRATAENPIDGFESLMDRRSLEYGDVMTDTLVELLPRGRWGSRLRFPCPTMSVRDLGRFGGRLSPRRPEANVTLNARTDGPVHASAGVRHGNLSVRPAKPTTGRARELYRPRNGYAWPTHRQSLCLSPALRSGRIGAETVGC
jgi:hypothetical protein